MSMEQAAQIVRQHAILDLIQSEWTQSLATMRMHALVTGTSFIVKNLDDDDGDSDDSTFYADRICNEHRLSQKVTACTETGR